MSASPFNLVRLGKLGLSRDESMILKTFVKFDFPIKTFKMGQHYFQDDSFYVVERAFNPSVPITEIKAMCLERAKATLNAKVIKAAVLQSEQSTPISTTTTTTAATPEKIEFMTPGLLTPSSASLLTIKASNENEILNLKLEIERLKADTVLGNLKHQARVDELLKVISDSRDENSNMKRNTADEVQLRNIKIRELEESIRVTKSQSIIPTLNNKIKELQETINFIRDKSQNDTSTLKSEIKRLKEELKEQAILSMGAVYEKNQIVNYIRSCDDHEYQEILIRSMENDYYLDCKIVVEGKLYKFTLFCHQNTKRCRSTSLTGLFNEWLHNAQLKLDKITEDLHEKINTLTEQLNKATTQVGDTIKAFVDKIARKRKAIKVQKKNCKYELSLLQDQIESLKGKLIFAQWAHGVPPHDPIKEEYRAKLKAAVEHFGEYRDDNGKSKWFSFNKAAVKSKFHEYFGRTSFLQVDEKNLSLEDSKKMFVIIEFICHKTGSKAVLWYGHFLFKKFITGNVESNPITVTSHVKRFYDTWGQWYDLEPDVDIQDKLVKGIKTLPTLVYAHMACKINCQRLAGSLLALKL
jgi:gas vesicle protein